VKAGLVSVEVDTGNPVCSLFVWDDVGGVPGPLVGGTPVIFAPSGYPTFDWVDLPVPYVDSDDFWIGIFVDNSRPPDASYALTDSITTFTRSFLSFDRSFWFDFGGLDPPIPGDLLIRAIVECPVPAVPDVAVDSILTPPDTVACLDTIAVSARVCNVGDTTVTFDVEAIIQGLYGDTVTVVNLMPDSCSILTFADWVVPDSQGICFDVNFSTLLAIDTNPSNDTMSTVSCAWCPASPDVSVDVIFAPPTTVACLDSTAVSALVCNVGDTIVTFDVEAIIPGIYGDTVTNVTLNPSGACSILTFVDWVVPDSHGTCFDITFRTLLSIDINPSNDTLTRTSCADCPVAPDVAMDSIFSPPDTVACFDTIAISARVCNVGDTTLTFDVEASIQGLYADTITVVDLMPDSCSTLTFADWVVPDSHGVCFDVKFEILTPDSDPSNDTMTTVSCADCPPPGIGEEPTQKSPQIYGLFQNQPNPFTNSAEIRYQLPLDAQVSLRIYDTAGRNIRTLVREKERSGRKKVLWDGRDDFGKRVNSGVYFYKLQTYTDTGSINYSHTRKLILLR
jgi:hypothetical protein